MVHQLKGCLLFLALLANVIIAPSLDLPSKEIIVLTDDISEPVKGEVEYKTKWNEDWWNDHIPFKINSFYIVVLQSDQEADLKEDVYLEVHKPPPLI